MGITRRGLILSGVAAGGGLALVYFARRLDDGDATTAFGASTPDLLPFNPWVKIGTDGAVVCGVHRAEMGQGVTTSLPMLIAEELDADWSQVAYEFTPVDKDYFNFGILLRGRPLGELDGRPIAAAGTALIREVMHQVGLSLTISSSGTVDAWDTLRLAGAAARAMLVEAAARRWGTPADRLRTERGRVIDPDNGRALPFGELAREASMLRPPSNPVLKSGSFALIGRSVPRLDVPAKVSGTATFGIDTRRPGMWFGAVRHGPYPRADIATFADDGARATPGVTAVVRLGSRAVGVFASDTWTAQRAADRLRVEAASPPGQPDTALLLAGYRESLDDPEPVIPRDDGDVTGAFRGREVIEAVYELPFLAHACMEPMNCAAEYSDGRLIIHAPTQAPTLARDVAAKIAGLDPAAVEIRQTLIGGGFGRRAEMDFIEEAAAAAVALPGRPLLLTWSRGEDLRHDTYRPAAVGRVRGVLDAGGRIAGLDYRLVTQSVTASNHQRTPTPRGGDPRRDSSVLGGVLETHYAVPNLRLAYVPRDDGMPVGFWRSVSHSINPFLLESFVDELAAAAGVDPVEFRLRHLADRPAERRVLERAAELAGWGRPLPQSDGRGVALIESHDSVVALVAEVSVRERQLSVKQLTAVVDCRTVVHPANVEGQIVGGIIDGLNAALQGRITVRDGAVEQGNFNDYPWLRLAGIPEIRVALLPQGGRPGGVGEPGVPAVAPALCNAIFAATGQRIRRLPILDELR